MSSSGQIFLGGGDCGCGGTILGSGGGDGDVGEGGDVGVIVGGGGKGKGRGTRTKIYKKPKKGENGEKSEKLKMIPLGLTFITSKKPHHNTSSTPASHELEPINDDIWESFYNKLQYSRGNRPERNRGK